jgi:hypothetical protein
MRSMRTHIRMRRRRRHLAHVRLDALSNLLEDAVVVLEALSLLVELALLWKGRGRVRR